MNVAGITKLFCGSQMIIFDRASPDLRWCVAWFSIGCVLVATVIYLSLTSNPIDLGVSFAYEDKLQHAFAYFVLMAWFGQLYHGRSERIIIALLLIFMGGTLEYFQSFNPHRFAEFGDMAANASGVILGFYLTLTNAKNGLLKIERWLA
jgi:VanZ family protein